MSTAPHTLPEVTPIEGLVTERDETRTTRGLDLYIGSVALLAVAAVTSVAVLEVGRPHGSVDWLVFAVIATLLFVTECRTTIWLRFGDGGVITPSWAFSFALMLLGSPTAAIATMCLTTMIAELAARKGARKVLFNTAQVSLSLAVGGLTLLAFGIRGPLFESMSMPFSWGVAMILGGTLVFVTNGVVICYLLSMLEHKSFAAMMREGFALTMSADAAMLALAPILVISLQYSMLMLPLIGTATFLVYQTARQALQRAHEANHDPLTGVLNRRAFNNELNDFTEQTGPAAGAVMILDIDRFKEINDRLGHQTGDAVLRAFAERIGGSLPSSAIVARLGGDEFAILLRDVSIDEARWIIEQLHHALGEPLSVEGFPRSTGTSIGVAVSPVHGSTPSELLHAADIAMYRAKQRRSCVEYYEPVGTTRERGRVTLLSDLQEAIDQREFLIDYQPQIDAISGAVCAVEALIRWEHPRLGRIEPSDFVMLAEQTDLIGPLTELVIRQAIADVADLDDDVVIAVNVSTRNIESRHFATTTLATLAETGMRPERLELEITENAISQDPERTRVTIEELRTHGVRISIDDFGTGYSSFATLRDTPVDRIKIDRSFISEMLTNERDVRIVRSIIELAHGLDLTVVGEGVEDEATWAALRAAGCDIAQGYLFSPPLPLARLRTLLAHSDDARCVTASDAGTTPDRSLATLVRTVRAQRTGDAVALAAP